MLKTLPERASEKRVGESDIHFMIMDQNVNFNAFEAFKLSNLNKVMGGVGYWREGSTLSPPSSSGKTSDSDEELITANGSDGCDSRSGCIDAQYDCGDGKLLWG